MAPTNLFAGLTGTANFILPFLSFFPFYLNLRYYQKTKIKDYLLLVWYFSYWFIIQGIVLLSLGFDVFNWHYDGLAGPELADNIFLLVRFLSPIDALPLALIALRSKYGTEFDDVPWYLISLITIPIVVTLVIGISPLWSVYLPADSFATGLHWSHWISRSILYGITAFCFLTADFLRIGKSVQSRNLWISSSILWIWAMIGFFLGNAVFKIDSGQNILLDALPTIGFVPASLLMLYNHIRHPESVLITQDQVHRVLDLYSKTIDLSINTSDPLSKPGLEHIKEYLHAAQENLEMEIK